LCSKSGEIQEKFKFLIIDELLNPENDKILKKYESPIDYLREQLNFPFEEKNIDSRKVKKLCAVGFKVFPNQLQVNIFCATCFKKKKVKKI